MPKKPEKNWKNTKMLIKQKTNILCGSNSLLALLKIAKIIKTLSAKPKAGIYIDVVLTSWHCWQKSWKSNKPIYKPTTENSYTYILYQCIIYQCNCRIYNFYLLLKSICIVRCTLFAIVKFPVIQLFDCLLRIFAYSSTILIQVELCKEKRHAINNRFWSVWNNHIIELQPPLFYSYQNAAKL
jgi:hypothetical protein